jgi:hypothetical protein
VRSTTAPYTESRLTRSVANERVGFPVVEQRVKCLAKIPQYHLLSIALENICPNIFEIY